MNKIAAELEPSQWHMILLSMAYLSQRSPGFDYALRTICHQIAPNAEEQYDQFRECNSDYKSIGVALIDEIKATTK